MVLDELRKELQAEKTRIEKLWQDSERKVRDLQESLIKGKDKRYDYFRFSLHKDYHDEKNSKLVKCPQCEGEEKLPIYSLKSALEGKKEYIECPLCKGQGKCYFIWGFDNEFRDWKHDAVC